MLSIGSTFRTMTQSALLTFLPVYLARDMGYSPLWIGACMFALAGRGLCRRADCRAPVRHHRPPADRRLQHVDDGAVVLLAMIFAGGTIWFVVLVAVLGFFLFAVRAVLQAWLLGCDAARTGRQRHRHSVRRPGGRRGDRPDLRRRPGRPFRHHGGVLFPRRHDHRREPDDLRDAVRGDQEHLAARGVYPLGPARSGRPGRRRRAMLRRQCIPARHVGGHQGALRRGHARPFRHVEP